jgi:hypothetical protein
MTSLLVAVLSVSTFATDYTITGGYYGTKIYQDNDTLLMTGGGVNSLTAQDYSVLDIRNTSPLAAGSGGIWELIIAENSRLIFSGGHVNRLDIGDYATATISDGQINKLASGYVYASTNHIEIVCQTHNYNTTSKILTGVWGNDSAFNIQLIDIGYGYSPTYDNIKFTIIPEPMTMVLLGLGGLLIRKK